MESMYDRATQAAGTQLTKMRWALGVNGALSLALGVLILVWPGISLFALTIVFGAYALATGVVGLVSAFSDDDRADHDLDRSRSRFRSRRWAWL